MTDKTKYQGWDEGPRRVVCGNRLRLYIDPNSDARVQEGGLRTRGVCKASRDGVPLVSVVTVCLNSERTIRQCMESVFAQTYPNVEYIVVDGVSTDGTVGIVQEFGQQIDYFVSEPDTGLYDAMNKGISLAAGDYVLLLNSDDWYEPDCIEQLVAETRRGDVDMVSALARYVNGKGEEQFITPVLPLDATTLIRNPLRHETMLVPAWMYEKFGPYDLRYGIIADLHFIIKLYEGGIRHRTVAKPLLNFRNSGVSSTDMSALVEERFRLLREQFPYVSADDLRIISDLQAMTKEQARDVLFRGRFFGKFHYAFKEFIQNKWRFDVATLEQQKFVHRQQPKFRVETISTNAGGGAGIGSVRRVEALRAIGVDVGLNAVFVPPNANANRLQRANGREIVWGEFLDSRAFLTRRNMNSFAASELFTSTTSVIRMADMLPVINRADVVHFHWMGGILDYANLDLLRDKPIAWTLADMAAFTGGCHYSEGCDGFTRDCSECPLIGEEANLPREIHAAKREAYAHLRNLHVICPSQWLADKARSSTLFGGVPVHVIPNPVPLWDLWPENKIVARIRLGLEPDKKYIMFGAENLASARKGGALLVEALNKYAASHDVDDVRILTFGNSQFDLPVRQHPLGFIDSADRLRAAYSAADLFAFPSREDNSPLTVSEAMACGTPVVAFPVGNVPDLVNHQTNGYLAPYLDTDAFAEGLAWALAAAPEARTKRSLSAVRSVRGHNNPLLSAQRHAELYREMMAAGGERRADKAA